MALPKFVYVGMGRSGSTLLHKVLPRHPEIGVSMKKKELDFFQSDDNFEQGLSWYEELFEGVDKPVLGDISPGYHSRDLARDRIAETLGRDTKIIFTFRNYVDFIFSRYIHLARSSMEVPELRKVLKRKGAIVRPLDVIVEKYIEAFGRENILFLSFEKDLRGSTPAFEKKIYEFLDVDASQSYYLPVSDRRVNGAASPRFIVTGRAEKHETHDGVDYVIPPNMMVYCSTRRRSKIWRKPSEELTEWAREVESRWTLVMRKKQYRNLQERFSLPLAERLSTLTGLDLGHWDCEPRRLAYGESPPPDRFRVKEAGED